MTEQPLSPEHEQAIIRKLTAEAEHLERENTQWDKECQDEDAQAGKHRIFSFTGQVNTASVKTCLDVVSHWHRRDPGRPITVTFNSPGGSVIDGLALYDYLTELRASGTHVETVALGMAASMGGILLQAGTKRVMGQHAVLLIHEVSSVNVGKVSEVEDELKFTKKLQSMLLDILAERSTLTKRQIENRWKKTDWWLDADEALDLGFIDEIRQVA